MIFYPTLLSGDLLLFAKYLFVTARKGFANFTVSKRSHEQPSAIPARRCSRPRPWREYRAIIEATSRRAGAGRRSPEPQTSPRAAGDEKGVVCAALLNMGVELVAMCYPGLVGGT